MHIYVCIASRKELWKYINLHECIILNATIIPLISKSRCWDCKFILRPHSCRLTQTLQVLRASVQPLDLPSSSGFSSTAFQPNPVCLQSPLKTYCQGRVRRGWAAVGQRRWPPGPGWGQPWGQGTSWAKSVTQGWDQPKGLTGMSRAPA